MVDCKNVLISVKKKSVFREEENWQNNVMFAKTISPSSCLPSRRPQGSDSMDQCGREEKATLHHHNYHIDFGNVLIWRFFPKKPFSSE